MGENLFEQLNYFTVFLLFQVQCETSYNTLCNYTQDQPNYNPVQIAELCKKNFQGRYLFPDAGRRYRSALAQPDSPCFRPVVSCGMGKNLFPSHMPKTCLYTSE